MQWPNTVHVTIKQFSSEDMALIKNLDPAAQRMRFTDDTGGIFEHELQKERTGHFTEHDSGHRKHRPKPQERQTKARAYWRERDHCGWTGSHTKPGRPDTNTSFNTPRSSRQTGITQLIHCDLGLQCLFIWKNACRLLLLVFLTYIFHKVV